MTSHDVVGRCRRIFSTRRVGHAGTLDPMATGVLVIGIDRATKILGLLTATSKSYAATIRLGQTTSTEDAEGELLQSDFGRTPDRRGDRRRGRRAARRHRAGAVVGQRDQGRWASCLSVGPRGPRRRTRGPTGTHRPVRGVGCAPGRRRRYRSRRRSRLLVGNLHSCAGPRSRGRARGGWPSDVVAAHPRRPLRAGRGALTRRSGGSSRG